MVTCGVLQVRAGQFSAVTGHCHSSSTGSLLPLVAHAHCCQQRLAPSVLITSVAWRTAEHRHPGSTLLRAADAERRLSHAAASSSAVHRDPGPLHAQRVPRAQHTGTGRSNAATSSPQASDASQQREPGYLPDKRRSTRSTKPGATTPPLKRQAHSKPSPAAFPAPVYQAQQHLQPLPQSTAVQLARNTPGYITQEAPLALNQPAPLAAASIDIYAEGWRPPEPLCKFKGLMLEKARPWQRGLVWHLCCELPPPACFIYQEMRASTLQRVLSQRAQLEKALRLHREEARWQAVRARLWLREMMKEQRMPSTAAMQEAAQQVVQLKSEIGITRSTLRALRATAATYSDTDYITYTEPMLDALTALSAFCDAYRSQHVPYAQALLHVNRRFVKDISTRHLSPDEALQQREVHLQQLGVMRLPQLPDLRHIQWRYPPQQYVWLQRKGRRKQPPAAVSPAPPPAVRDKELLPCEATVLAFD